MRCLEDLPVGANDAFLLDAYSETVSGVVERAGPSVASVKVVGHASNRDAALGEAERLLGRQRRPPDHAHRHQDALAGV
jgi:hypothetical protein